jgi:hypothetical protein
LSFPPKLIIGLSPRLKQKEKIGNSGTSSTIPGHRPVFIGERRKEDRKTRGGKKEDRKTRGELSSEISSGKQGMKQ